MNKLNHIITVLLLAFIMGACSEDDSVSPSDEALFPPSGNSEIDQLHRQMFGDYNTRVEYRYIKNLIPSDWYYITPAEEEKVIPFSELVVKMWLNPLIKGSSKEFIGLTFPKLLVYIGSPAYQQDGSRILGQAEGGTIIRFTEVNYYDEKNTTWINTQMHTAYHEYSHIIHQRFGLPNEFRKITPDSYVKSGWMTVSYREALQRGIVTPYGCSSVQEDFAEIFATYIIASDQNLAYYTEDVEPQSTADVLDNQGRAILRQKLSIQKKYMKNIGINMEVIRETYQDLLSE